MVSDMYQDPGCKVFRLAKAAHRLRTVRIDHRADKRRVQKTSTSGCRLGISQSFCQQYRRYEANADATVKLSRRWSTSLLAHYENETKTHDSNDDGFVDIPRVKQYNLWNRWAYMGDRYVFQAGIKGMSEQRNSGQDGHNDNRHTISMK